MGNKEELQAIVAMEEGLAVSASSGPAPSAASPTIESILDSAVRDGIESGTVSALVLHMNADTAVAYGKAAEEKTKQEVERTQQAKECTAQSREDTKKRWGFNIVQSVGLCIVGVGFMTKSIDGIAAMGAICAIYGVDIFRAGAETVLKLAAKRTAKSLPPVE